MIKKCFQGKEINGRANAGEMKKVDIWLSSAWARRFFALYRRAQLSRGQLQPILISHQDSS